MSASTLHLDHLSTILNKTGILRQRRSLSENDLREFYDTIALDRIHLSRQDWQGHCVSTLIGHLPNLKPAVQDSLSRFVVGRWNARAADSTVASGRHAKDERLAVSQLGKDSGIPLRQPFVSPAMPIPRRDWFDRFTDWVAALVSLFK